MSAKLGEEKINEINEALKEYIENTDIPIVAEFAYMNHIRRALLYENEILSYTIKELINKKEAQLERMALENDVDKTMAIFSLKQLGWRDKQDIVLESDNKLDITVEYVKNESKN